MEPTTTRVDIKALMQANPSLEQRTVNALERIVTLLESVQRMMMEKQAPSQPPAQTYKGKR